MILSLIIISFLSCTNNTPNNTAMDKQINIIFLHHSTGKVIWYGDKTSIWNKVYAKLFKQRAVQRWFNKYNKVHSTNYTIRETYFPTKEGYGWKNYPYDYYNIWVKNAGDSPYKGEPTLEMLTKKYDVIILKHCFPVGMILADTDSADINSDVKTIANYKLQYAALKNKMKQFPNTKFIVWTGAARVESMTTPEEAQRAKDFFNWVKTEWDEPGDNIYIWDFYELETEGGLYLKDEYSMAKGNNHPGFKFAGRVSPLFCQRIVDVIENNGEKTTLTGGKRL
jgi:hypothetical protein